MNPEHDLYLMTTHLIQIQSKDLLIQLFMESVNDIFPGHEFKWCSEHAPKSISKLPVCNRNRNYGAITFAENAGTEPESYALLQNAVQMLAVALEKLEQDQFIADQKLHLQYLVAEKAEKFELLNKEYMAMNEELLEGNKRLQESELRYRTISRLSSDFSYSCIYENGSFVVNWITDAFFSISGYSREELKKHGTWLFTSHPDDRDRMMTKLSSLIPGAVSKDEFRLLSKSGEVRTISNRTECVGDMNAEGGRRFFGSVEDITDRIHAEEARQNKVLELARFNSLMTGRENKMVELKNEVNGLLNRLGETKKYRTQSYQ